MTDPVLLPHPLPRHLSHSQVKSIEECGEKYWLERGIKIPSAPWWASVGGTAMHNGSEVLDFALEGFWTLRVSRLTGQSENAVIESNETGGRTAYEPDTDQSAEGHPWEVDDEVLYETVLAAVGSSDGFVDGKDPQVPQEYTALADLLMQDAIREEQRKLPEQFRDTGTWRAASKGTEGEAWWARHLPLFLARWVHWRQTSGYRIARIDDLDLAVEMEVGNWLEDGDTTFEVIARLDRVMLDSEGYPSVVDLKSNGREPSSGEQLGAYAALLQTHGFPRPLRGTHWLGRTGTIGRVYDLTQYTPEYFQRKYGKVFRERNAGKFVANLASPFCKSCSLADYCHARKDKGKYAHLVPRPDVPGNLKFKGEVNG